LEGLNAVDGSDLFVYEKPQDAAKLIANLHLNAALRKTTAAAGRRFVEQSHGWPQIHHRIRQEVAGLRFSCRPEPDADFGYPSQQVFPAYADAQKGLPVVQLPMDEPSRVCSLGSRQLKRILLGSA
jgi:hypothetical protein